MLECITNCNDQPLVTRFLNSQVKLKFELGFDTQMPKPVKFGRVVNPIALLSTTVGFGWLMINAKE